MKILFFTHRLPYAPNRGDRVRAYHLLHELSGWAEVDLVSLVHDDDEASHIRDLRDVTSSITVGRVPRILNAIRAGLALPTSKPTTHSMLRAPGLAGAVERLASERRPDLVFAYCTGIAPLASLPSLRNVPLVLDMVDVDSAKWAMLAKTSAPPLSWIYAREARLLRRFEREESLRAKVTMVVTAKEQATLKEIAPAARVEVVGNGVDAQPLKRPNSAATAAPIVVFCGVMNYAPNVEGALWLAREVWPRVREKRPDAQLQIVGSQPIEAVKRLADQATGITVTGQVPDVRPYLWGASVAAAPLLTARGIQNKVLEAVAAGLPTVVTSQVFEGLPPEVHSACIRASDAASFGDAIVKLLGDSPEARLAMTAAADVDALSWTHQLGSLRRLLREI